MLCHPDKVAKANDEEKAEAERKFGVVNKAYIILSDPEKRDVIENEGKLPLLYFQI